MSPASTIALHRVLVELHAELRDEIEQYPNEDQQRVVRLREQIAHLQAVLNPGA